MFAKERLKLGTYFGAYQGVRLTRRDRKAGLGYAFEIRQNNGKTAYLIDASDPKTSNWMRCLSPIQLSKS